MGRVTKVNLEVFGGMPTKEEQTKLCFVCRSPITEREAQYRGEPVHPDCRPADGL